MEDRTKEDCTMTMTKAERTELKQAVRLQFKVLRHEVTVREKELLSAAEDEIDERFDENHDKEEALLIAVRSKLAEWDVEVRALIEQAGLSLKEATARRLVDLTVRLEFAEQKRNVLRMKTATNLHAKVAEAHTALDRQEADMLRKLTLDALESDEARSFFDAIPSVSQLVPSVRLAELEAQFGGDK